MFMPDLNFFHSGSWILYPEVKNAPDPGSATLPVAAVGVFSCGTDLVGLRSCPVMLSDMSIMMNRCRIMPSFVFPDQLVNQLTFS